MSSELNALLAARQTSELSAAHEALGLGATDTVERGPIISAIITYVENLVKNTNLTPGEVVALITQAEQIVEDNGGKFSLSVLLQIIAIIKPYLIPATPAA